MSDVNEKTAKAANEGAKRAQGAAAHVTHAAEHAEAQAAGKASEIGHAVQDAAGRVGRAVSDGYERVSGRACESFEQSRDAARRWEQGFESSVQQRPLIAVFIAAAVGVLLGLLFARHKRD